MLALGEAKGNAMGFFFHAVEHACVCGGVHWIKWVALDFT